MKKFKLTGTKLNDKYIQQLFHKMLSSPPFRIHADKNIKGRAIRLKLVIANEEI